MSLFIRVPNELIQTIIVYIDAYDDLEYFEAYIKQVVPSYLTNWEYIFSMKLPDFYKEIKTVQNTDHRLNTTRYTNPFAWRMYYTDIINLMIDQEKVKHLREFDIYAVKIYINIINIETKNIILGTRIHHMLNNSVYGQILYIYSMMLPDTPITHAIFYYEIGLDGAFEGVYDNLFKDGSNRKGLTHLYLYLKYTENDPSIKLNTKEVFIMLEDDINLDEDDFRTYEYRHYYYSIIRDILLFLFKRLFNKSITYDDIIKHEYVKQMIDNVKCDDGNFEVVLKDTVKIFNKS